MEKLEAQVKRKLKAHLRERCGSDIYWYMSVPSGYGESTLDFLCFYRGFGFAIETKAPGKKLTPRQKKTKQDIEASGTPVFVIDGEDKYGPLNRFLRDIDIWYHQINQSE